jgi:hypothetical protein
MYDIPAQLWSDVHFGFSFFASAFLDEEEGTAHNLALEDVSDPDECLGIL